VPLTEPLGSRRIRCHLHDDFHETISLDAEVNPQKKNFSVVNQRDRLYGRFADFGNRRVFLCHFLIGLDLSVCQLSVLCGFELMGSTFPDFI